MSTSPTIFDISLFPFLWSSARPRAAVGRMSFALLRLLSVLSKTQKSLPISEPFLVRNLEKRRVKRADASVPGKTFAYC